MKTRNVSAQWLEKYQRWQIKVTNEDGVRKTFTCSMPGRKGQTECNRKADDWLLSGLKSPDARCGDLVTSWLDALKDECITRDVNGETVYTDRYVKAESIARVHLMPALKLVKISRLTAGDLQSIIHAAAKKGCAKKTLMNIRSIMSLWLNYCRKLKVTHLTTEDVVLPKNAPSKEKRILQPEELRILMSTSTTVRCGKTVEEWYINLWRLAVVLGYRPGELLALERSHLKNGVLRVRGSINDRNIKTSGKNNNAIRDTVLPKIALDILSDQIRMLTKAGIVSPYLFPTPQGTISNQSTTRHRWTRYCESNGITTVTPYELRHTYVSVCSGRGDLSLSELKSLIGHSKNMDTLGVYAHKLADADTRLAASVNQIFEGVIKELG